MNNWFECKVKYEKQGDNGKYKKVTEPYIIDALSVTEAEGRIVDELAPYLGDEFFVSDINEAKYNEIFFCNEDSADKWYKCKVVFVALDEKKSVEKRTSTYMLVQASGLKDALDKLVQGMYGTMADYEIASISETMIIGVYRYSVKQNELVTESENEPFK